LFVIPENCPVDILGRQFRTPVRKKKIICNKKPFPAVKMFLVVLLAAEDKKRNTPACPG
jgi:hypothetical protein